MGREGRTNIQEENSCGGAMQKHSRGTHKHSSGIKKSQGRDTQTF